MSSKGPLLKLSTDHDLDEGDVAMQNLYIR